METQTFIRLLATHAILEPLRTRARQSWMHQWGSLLAQQPGPSLTRCWSVVGSQEPMTRHRMQKTCWGTSPRRKARHRGSDAGLKWVPRAETFDLLCVCVFVWRGCWFHGVGFHVWVLVSRFWFGHVRAPWTALRHGPPFPPTALPLDRPRTSLPKTALPLDRRLRGRRGFT